MGGRGKASEASFPEEVTAGLHAEEDSDPLCLREPHLHRLMCQDESSVTPTRAASSFFKVAEMLEQVLRTAFWL